MFAQDFQNDPWVQYTVDNLQAITDPAAMVAAVGVAFSGPIRVNSRIVEACNRLGLSRYIATTRGDIRTHIKSLVADYGQDEELPWMQRAVTALDKVGWEDAVDVVSAVVDTVDSAFNICKKTEQGLYRARLGII